MTASRRNGVALALATILLATMGCREVTPATVAGTWVIVDRHLLSRTQKVAAATLVLDPNGTFVATEIPGDEYYAPPEVAGPDIISGSGVWRLVDREGRQTVELVFRDFTKGREWTGPFGFSLGIWNGWSTTALYYYQGDPDSGLRVSFEKKN